MEVKANQYNDNNKPQENDAKELINALLENDFLKKYDIILDIGCGSGNVTKMLSERIQHNRIVALDVDPEMVKFSQTNFASDSIEYIIQDISQSWDELSSTLKELEGKVSLIFSNRVLHWVNDKETAATNMSKLLAKGGDICLNITEIPDLKPNLNDELKEKVIDIPSIEEQFEFWEKSLMQKGIKFSVAKILHLKAAYDGNTFSTIWAVCLKLHKLYIKCSEDITKIRKSENLSIAFIKTMFFGPNGEINANSYQELIKNYQNGITMRYEQFRFIGNKE